MSSEITNPGERKLVVVSGRAHPKLAEEIAQALDHDLLPTSAYTFANGETYVRFEESVRGIRVIKALGRSPEQIRGYAQAVDVLQER